MWKGGFSNRRVMSTQPGLWEAQIKIKSVCSSEHSECEEIPRVHKLPVKRLYTVLASQLQLSLHRPHAATRLTKAELGGNAASACPPPRSPPPPPSPPLSSFPPLPPLHLCLSLQLTGLISHTTVPCRLYLLIFPQINKEKRKHLAAT